MSVSPLNHCFFKRLGYTGCQLRADGQHDRAHLVPQQRVKQVGKRRGWTAEEIAEAIWDRRCYVMACRSHHSAFDQKQLRLTEDQYPDSFRDWALEHAFEFRGARDGWVGVYVEPESAA